MSTLVARLLRCLFLLISCAGSLAFVRVASAQESDDIRLYGFFQGLYRNSNVSGNLGGPAEFSTFSLQQLNGFASKQLNPSFSAFVNAELTNTFSTEKGWGTLRLEEAWMRYNHSAYLNVKAGLLVPTFNNLNEVKNRTPLLPYIFRPVAYEATFSNITNLEALVPNRAYVQVYGALPLGDMRFDYAAYMGNSEPSYAAKGFVGTIVAGMDTTKSKLYGGRLGVRYGGLKVGVSGTYDMHKRDQIRIRDLTIPVGLGEMERTRLGGDLSYSIGRVFGEAEAIFVRHSLDDAQKARLDFLANSNESPLRGVITNTPDMTFYYGLVGYNITDRFYGYMIYNFIKDGNTVASEAGTYAYGPGLGFRPIDTIVLKSQYIRSGLRENPRPAVLLVISMRERVDRFG